MFIPAEKETTQQSGGDTSKAQPRVPTRAPRAACQPLGSLRHRLQGAAASHRTQPSASPRRHQLSASTHPAGLQPRSLPLNQGARSCPNCHGESKVLERFHNFPNLWNPRQVRRQPPVYLQYFDRFYFEHWTCPKHNADMAPDTGELITLA